MTIDSAVRFGDDIKIQDCISVSHGVTLEDRVFCGPRCVFTHDTQPRSINTGGTLKSADDWVLSQTRVRMGASIGAHVSPGSRDLMHRSVDRDAGVGGAAETE